jgi:16S rRNA (cytidine1402-2'-O)-methyltransferase
MASNRSEKGTLYLIPNTLGKTPENNTIPEYVLNIIRRLEVLIVENVQTASRYLQWVGNTVPEYNIEFLVLNKKTPAHEILSFLKP